MDYTRVLICVAIMAIATYFPRVLPIAIFKKKINNRYMKSFLAYMPYTVLAAMTFPEVLYSTGNLLSGICGLAFAMWLAYRGKSLLTVAIGSIIVVFVAEQLMNIII